MKNDLIISPIFYMGNKKKLINKGLCNLFPKNIHTLYDLCSGSAIVSMNTKANRYVINDIDDNLFKFYKLFKLKSSQEIIKHILYNINKFGMKRTRTEQNTSEAAEYKKRYILMRDYANQTHNQIDIYSCMFYAFSQQMRFNSKGEFNMPFGNRAFNELNEQYIKNGCNFFSQPNVYISRFDFRKLPIDKLSTLDFVYLDPPYLNTIATYNENNNWDLNDEKSLYKFCENLNKANIKWGLSNVFENKGKINNKLIEWCEQNDWNIYTFDKFTYMACGKGNSQAKEVFICNY